MLARWPGRIVTITTMPPRPSRGRIPYRDFAFEYPVLSYPLFLIPRLVVSDFESYRYAFMAEMFLFDVAAIVLIARHGGAERGDRDRLPGGWAGTRSTASCWLRW